MFCWLFRNCNLSTNVINQPGRIPVFHHIRLDISSETPGVSGGTVFYDRSIVAYDVFNVPSDRIFVLEYVSALITRGNDIPYPPNYLNDYGAVGYKLGDEGHFHTIPFERSEPSGMLHASQSIRMYIPSGATVIVKAPLIPGQTGGSDVNVSGCYI